MNGEIGGLSPAAGVLTAVLAAGVSALLIVILYPLLERYALAEPNARSSHHTPTPQGGGIAVIAATLAAIGVTFGFQSFGVFLEWPLPTVIAGTVAMACVGVTADIDRLRIGTRFVLQAIIVVCVIGALPDHLRVFSALPWWLERLLLVLGGLWFVNLVNFMDGLDWMIVAEVIPLAASLAVLGMAHALPPAAAVVALALGGALLGFAYFNRPIATLFLGDVGSLPIGLILGWLLLLVAVGGHLTAAILMPLYYLADATITLLRRLIRGEPVWEAHRMHFYQIATDRGFAVIDVVTRVFLLNIGLGALAVVTVFLPGKVSNVAALLVGATLVARLLFAFTAGKKGAAPAA